jgi:Flp pilus assembly protein TadG
MRSSRRHAVGRNYRYGEILIMFALLLPVLLGMTELVIDGGLMMAVQRQRQNPADAAAMAGQFYLVE